MKQLLQTTLLIASILLSLHQEAQAMQQPLHTKSKKSIKAYEEARVLVRRRQVFQAIDLLEGVLKKDPSFMEARKLLAGSYASINQLQKAIEAYQLLRATDASYETQRTALALGDLLYRTGQYGAALEALQSIDINQLPRDVAPSVRKVLQDARYALELMANPVDFKPEPLPEPLNTLASQYFPVLSVDGRQLIYTGRKGLGPRFDEDIYIATQGETGDWQNPQSISSTINTYANEGTCTISADGRTLIYTSCSRRDGYGSCDLYISYKTGDKWTPASNLGPLVNSNYWESQPSLSADGRQLYFCSDRPGGLGKTDIWLTKLDSLNQWGAPENLGAPVNTAYEEISPFIHVNDENLYYASKGLPGMGGFDLYSTLKSDSGWSAPTNLGYPLNTISDEVSLFISADGTQGFYSYEEQPDLNQPIRSFLYRFEVPDEITVANRSTYLTGRIYDAKSGRSIGASVDLYLTEPGTQAAQFASDSVTGTYFTVLTEGRRYTIYIKRPGYLFKSLQFLSVAASNLTPQVIDIALEPISSGATTILNNLFFDTDSYVLRKESLLELNTLVEFMQVNPKRRILIRGHTDNVGGEIYNKELSENRAKSVYTYLLGRGIAQGRIRYKGFGQSEPAQSNDTEQGRQANRRIDFQVF